jgi:hypothetical protein
VEGSTRVEVARLGDSAFIRRTRHWRAGCTQPCLSGSGGGGWIPLATRGWPPTSSQTSNAQPTEAGHTEVNSCRSVRCGGMIDRRTDRHRPQPRSCWFARTLVLVLLRRCRSSYRGGVKIGMDHFIADISPTDLSTPFTRAFAVRTTGLPAGCWLWTAVGSGARKDDSDRIPRFENEIAGDFSTRFSLANGQPTQPTKRVLRPPPPQ